MQSQSLPEAFVISSLDDAVRLRSSPARLWAVRGPIEVRIPGFALQDRAQLESRLTALADVCGCAEGAAAGALALVAVIVVWMQRGGATTYRGIVAALLTIVSVSLLAKLLRVCVARFQLWRALGDLLYVSPERLPPFGPGAPP